MTQAFTLMDVISETLSDVGMRPLELFFGICGPFGICLAIYFYIWPRKTARLSCFVEENLIIGLPDSSFNSELNITFRGINVPRVTVSHVKIWNSGFNTIKRSDIVLKEPLAISLEVGGQILQADIYRRNRDVIDSSVKRVSEKYCLIDFEFLDPGDGFSISVLHTANAKNLGVKGTVMGLSGGLSHVERDLSNFTDVLIISCVAILSVIIINCISFYMTYLFKVQFGNTGNSIYEKIIFLISTGSAYMIGKNMPKKYGWRKIPKFLH